MDWAIYLPTLMGAVTKIADQSLKSLGGDLYECAARFVERLFGATKDHTEDAKTLRSFEKLPDDYQEEMRQLLQRHLQENAALQEAATQLVAHKDAPSLMVRLEAKIAERQTGVEELNMGRGSADVGLKADDVKSQVGIGKATLG